MVSGKLTKLESGFLAGFLLALAVLVMAASTPSGFTPWSAFVGTNRIIIRTNAAGNLVQVDGQAIIDSSNSLVAQIIAAQVWTNDHGVIRPMTNVTELGLTTDTNSILIIDPNNVFLGAFPPHIDLSLNLYNTSIGEDCLRYFTNGTGNATVGGLGNLRRGDYNTALGDGAGGGVVYGNNNVFVGESAGATSGITNSDLTGVGYYTFYNLADNANPNEAFGSQALYNDTIGIANVANGFKAGYTTTVGSSNIFLGHMADAAAGVSNSIVIGHSIIATANNTVLIGSDPANFVVKQDRTTNATPLDVAGLTTLYGGLQVKNSATLDGGVTIGPSTASLFLGTNWQWVSDSLVPNHDLRLIDNWNLSTPLLVGTNGLLVLSNGLSLPSGAGAGKLWTSVDTTGAGAWSNAVAVAAVSAFDSIIVTNGFTRIRSLVPSTTLVSQIDFASGPTAYFWTNMVTNITLQLTNTWVGGVSNRVLDFFFTGATNNGPNYTVTFSCPNPSGLVLRWGTFSATNGGSSSFTVTNNHGAGASLTLWDTNLVEAYYSPTQ